MPHPKRTQPSNAGIVTDKAGDRFIPESQRADGTTRKAIKIRPGYRPTEDVELYRSRPAELRSLAQQAGPPGTVGLSDDKQADTAASNKNAKKREAKKRAKAAAAAAGGTEEAAGNGVKNNENKQPVEPKAEETAQNGMGPKEAADKGLDDETDEELVRSRKVRGLRKKLRQARELQSKKESGEALIPEQIAKVIKINELVRELEALGVDDDGEPLQKP